MRKFKIYANYVFQKELGIYEADSVEEAVEMALEEAEPDICLCCQCSQKFVDNGKLDEESWLAYGVYN